MDHVVGPLHILLAEKEERIWFNIICLKIYQCERTTWWCLYVMESFLDCIMESAPKYVLKVIMLKKYQKNNGHLKFASSPPLGCRPDENFGRPWNLIHSPPCRTPCRFFIHEVFFGPLGLHLRVWSQLGRSLPFQPMRALRLQWSWIHGPSVLCVKWPLRCSVVLTWMQKSISAWCEIWNQS